MGDYMRGMEGSTCTVNGQVNPYLEVEAGEVFRLRLVNASTARFYRLQLQSHAAYVVGTDGGLLREPYAVTDLLLSPGERADVLFQAPATAGTYKLLSLPYARMGMMTSAQVTLLTVGVKKASRGRAAPRTLPAAVNDVPAPAMEPPFGGNATFVLSMGMGRGYINGVTFEGMDHSFTHMSQLGTYEIWEIVNDSNMDHPWHQHVNDAQVIGVSSGDATYLRYAQMLMETGAWKDTVIVPKFGSVTLRIPILDHAGMTMFHCHILEHEDIGMMGMWHIMKPGMGM
jgi:FtsP/CotA-like multicopper oxidase with cupredoxin domain